MCSHFYLKLISVGRGELLSWFIHFKTWFLLSVENKLYFVPQQGLSRQPSLESCRCRHLFYSIIPATSQSLIYFSFLDLSFPRHIWKVLINNFVSQIQHEIKKWINQGASIHYSLLHRGPVWIAISNLFSNHFTFFKKREDLQPPYSISPESSRLKSLSVLSGRARCKDVTWIEDNLVTLARTALFAPQTQFIIFWHCQAVTFARAIKYWDRPTTKFIIRS